MIKAAFYESANSRQQTDEICSDRKNAASFAANETWNRGLFKHLYNTTEGMLSYGSSNRTRVAVFFLS